MNEDCWPLISAQDAYDYTARWVEAAVEEDSMRILRVFLDKAMHRVKIYRRLASHLLDDLSKWQVDVLNRDVVDCCHDGSCVHVRM